MNCPRCGKPLPGGATFCMHCGQMLAGASRPAPQPMMGVPGYAPPNAYAIPADVRKRNTWIAIAVSAAVLLLLFFGLNAAGVLRLGAKGDDPTLKARGLGPDPTLAARGNGGNPTMQATRKTMPDDLYNWLKHLEKCEKMKQALTGTQMREMKQVQAQLQGASGLTTPEDVNNMSDPDYNSFPTLDKAMAVFNRFQPDWENLKKEFDSVPPPAECKPIAQAYDNGLDSIIEVFASLSKIVENVNLTNPGDIKSSADDARKTGLHHERSIDGEFQSTDDLVQKICDKYDTKKWFKIDAHGGSGGIFGY